MKKTEFEIVGPCLLDGVAFHYDRGFFTERFRMDVMNSLGLPFQFVQDNFSRSRPGVLRGLHYQWAPAQGKLVTCLRGRIFDVAVDIRQSSPTYGRHIAVELSGDQPQWFWIPAGFAHGFCVMGDEAADVLYKVDQLWAKEGEAGLNYSDPELGIHWPVQKPILTEKDARMQSFSDYRLHPRF